MWRQWCSDKGTQRREERRGQEAESLAEVAKMAAVMNGKAEKKQRNVPKEEPAFGEDGLRDLVLERAGEMGWPAKQGTKPSVVCSS